MIRKLTLSAVLAVSAVVSLTSVTLAASPGRAVSPISGACGVGSGSLLAFPICTNR